jgi:hypothetical protein
MALPVQPYAMQSSPVADFKMTTSQVVRREKRLSWHPSRADSFLDCGPLTIKRRFHEHRGGFGKKRVFQVGAIKSFTPDWHTILMHLIMA